MSVLQKLFDAADNHAEDTGEDHTVGDLQDLLSAAWALMTKEQRTEFLKSDEVEQVVECGARDEFDVDTLVEDLEREPTASDVQGLQRG